MILAAIDIGSNAARLLVMQVTQNAAGADVFTKLNLFRIPLRLGFDVFEKQKISPEKETMFLETMEAFKHLMKAYKVEASIACATSAMRDAQNAPQISERIKDATGIDIEIITGDMEANIIYENHIAETLDKEHSYLYIDVGGGSTELSFFSNTILTYKHSFNIGTIRILKNQVTEQDWNVMKETVKAVTKGHKQVIAIGSGGNINKVFSMSKKKEGKPVYLQLLRDLHAELAPLSINERKENFGLRDDRADVIVPALQIYMNCMRWAGANEMYVPKIGLADGLVQHLWSSIKKEQKTLLT